MLQRVLAQLRAPRPYRSLDQCACRNRWLVVTYVTALLSAWMCLELERSERTVAFT